MSFNCQISLGDLINLLGIGVSVWIALKSFRESRNASIFNERVILYSKLALPLEKLLMILNYDSSVIEELYYEVADLVSSAYFIASSEVYNELDGLLKILENQMNSQSATHFDEFKKKINSVAEVMKAEMKRGSD
ncbi:hypothetical protein [Streptococcus merionis]|uniref:hypothetical protein n=1 Tax=Streptococcus merionis TaxID=400065 RepID=UPI0026EE0930|nr:hypothetical protein [Streptococcus merionis]